MTANLPATVYGVTSCSTVRAARRALDAQGVSYNFVDIKTDPPAISVLDRWAHTAGLDRLINRRSTTWRALSSDERAAADDAATAIPLLAAYPTLIKRPVVEWPDGRVTVGYANGEFTPTS